MMPKDKKKKKTAPDSGGGEETITKKEFLEALDTVIVSKPKADQGKRKTSE